MKTVVSLLALVLVAPGCKRRPSSSPPAPESQTGSAPAAAERVREAAGRASAAISELQQQLGGRLIAELGRGGPAAALEVCSQQAQAVTARVAEKTGVALGRTSHKLRNPGNAPRPWVRPYLDAAAGKKVANVQEVTVDLGDRVGVLVPIGMAPPCLACHGPPGALAPPVADLLRKFYPIDQALGFAAGDFRGYFWAEARHPTP